MKSSIFIKSYEKDRVWLTWCLRFLCKYWMGTPQIVIMAPNVMHGEIDAAMETGQSWKDGQPILYAYKFCEMEPWPNDYIGQQYFKMMADLYCDGQYITYLDSDTMLMRPLGLADLLVDDYRPKFYVTPYIRIPDAARWQEVVFDLFGERTKFEYMRRLPVTHHRHVVTACRSYLENKHQKQLREIVQPRSLFSEFNVLGHFAFTRHPSLYAFLDTDKVTIEPNWVEQYWSHGGISKERIEQFEGELRRDWSTDPLPSSNPQAQSEWANARYLID